MPEFPTRAHRPLARQPAAPPIVPPRRPIVAVAMADDHFVSRVREQTRRLEAALEGMHAALARLPE